MYNNTRAAVAGWHLPCVSLRWCCIICQCRLQLHVHFKLWQSAINTKLHIPILPRDFHPDSPRLGSIKQEGLGHISHLIRSWKWKQSPDWGIGLDWSSQMIIDDEALLDIWITDLGPSPLCSVSSEGASVYLFSHKQMIACYIKLAVDTVWSDAGGQDCNFSACCRAGVSRVYFTQSSIIITRRPVRQIMTPWQSSWPNIRVLDSSGQF